MAPGANGSSAHSGDQPALAQPFRSALERQNEYRKSVNLPAVSVDAALNAGAEKHAEYVIKNKTHAAHWRVSGGRLGAGDINPLAQAEAPDNPWFTPQGAAAARSATVLMGPKVPDDGAVIIDQFMAMPFSAISVLDPQMRAMGAGVYCEEGECAAVWAFDYGLAKEEFVQIFDDPGGARWNPALGIVPIGQAKLRAPVQFPPNGGTTHVLTYEGNEVIEALSSCDGYEPPTGAAIVLMVGKGSSADGVVNVGDHSLSNSKGPLDHCVFDAANFKTLDQFHQDSGRRGLARLGAVVMIPRAPLIAGERYDVAITADHQPYAWSFTAGEPV
ncbi:MAG: CAP domain-containing protein, partial [Candidatus Binataceae bacterium]